MLFALLVAVAAWAGPAGAKDPSISPPDTGDLTGLSLSELYNLEVVQPNIIGGHADPAGQIIYGYDYVHATLIRPTYRLWC